MAAVDAARGGRQFAEDDINAPGAESPGRPTMGPSDHFNADQFAGINVSGGEGREADRHPHYIGGLSVHEWRTGSRNDHHEGAS